MPTHILTLAASAISALFMPVRAHAAESTLISSGGVYTLSSGGKFLTALSDKNGAGFAARDSDGTWAQRFVLRYDSAADAYRIFPMISENGRRRVLDIIKRNKKVEAGCAVEIYNPVDPAAQLFKIIRLKNGTFKISPKSNTAVALTFSDGGASVGTCGQSVPAAFQWEIKSVTDWQYMFITKGEIATVLSDRFGSPRGESQGHKGLDIVAERRGKIRGYTISSVADGRVIFEGYSKTAGNYIAIRQKDGFTVRYLHMLNRSPKRTGDYVKKGEKIGNVGTSGSSTGYHLHFDCNTVGAYRGGDGPKNVNLATCVDPEPFFRGIKFKRQ